MGRRLVVDYSTSGTYPYEVVGVVNDVRFGGPRSEPRPEIYIPHAQRPYLVMNIALRSASDPGALAPAVRQVLQELDAQKPAHGVHTLDDLLGATYARDRQAMLALLVFAAAAAFLSLLGVHGVLLHRVRERTREIGIRMAIGAGQGKVLSWVAAHGLRLTFVGVGLGLVLAAASSHVLEALLFGVSATDPAAALPFVAFPLAAPPRLAPSGLAGHADRSRGGPPPRMNRGSRAFPFSLPPGQNRRTKGGREPWDGASS